MDYNLLALFFFTVLLILLISTGKLGRRESYTALFIGQVLEKNKDNINRVLQQGETLLDDVQQNGIPPDVQQFMDTLKEKNVFPELQKYLDSVQIKPKIVNPQNVPEQQESQDPITT